MTAVYESRWADATDTERAAMLVMANHGKMIFSAPGMAEYLRQDRSSDGEISS
ncbi:MAG: hypothetical protein ACR2P2_18505 [Nakamurella sp.]